MDLLRAAAAAGAALLLAACSRGGPLGPAGPRTRSTVGGPKQASLSEFGGGAPSRLALLVTDANAPWLPLVHGLKAVGVPITATQDPSEAARHDAILAYPSLEPLRPEAAAALRGAVSRGSVLISVGPIGAALQDVFGASDSAAAPRQRLLFSNASVARDIQLGRAGIGALRGAAYETREAQPLASYENGDVASTWHAFGKGRAYAVGVDVGYVLYRGYDGRDEYMARSYVNGFEPAADALLLLLKSAYAQAPNAATLGTVPDGKALSVLLTHDVDYAASVDNSLAYAEYERTVGIKTTYFVQTKYTKDFNDVDFFAPARLAPLRAVAALGHEIASHSVSHSLQFNVFPLGDGRERYPRYRPFVRDARTTTGGTVLGELRVSKYLLELTVSSEPVLSFRPGDLRNPWPLAQALQAAGYRYSSTLTANNALTHLPFQLTWSREAGAQTGIYEFPVTLEDEEKPALDRRLPQALSLARSISRYGGLFVILIHPNVVEPKLGFERAFVQAWKGRAWFGRLRDFGDWWSARDEASVDVDGAGDERTVTLRLPRPIAGLPLELPRGWRLADPAAAVALGPREEQALVTGVGELRLRLRRR